MLPPFQLTTTALTRGGLGMRSRVSAARGAGAYAQRGGEALRSRAIIALFSIRLTASFWTSQRRGVAVAA